MREWFELIIKEANEGRKDASLLALMNELTQFHYKKCLEYRNIVNGIFKTRSEYLNIADVPYIPVSLFKTMDLLSIDKANVFKVLTSSGTTSSRVSKIYLDQETAQIQTRALASIMQKVLGPKRLPMLLLDSPHVLKDRKSFSARGAGLLGMMNFGRDHFYALNEAMEVDKEALFEWLKKNSGQELLIFGFTFMAWQYLYQQCKDGEIDLSKAIFIHSGGWKKLKDQQIGNAEFKELFFKRFALKKIYNFYGMVEQVGSVYVECDEGFLHTPDFSEVIIRDPKNWGLQKMGEVGVIQALSVLPRSYPGHSILTEDLGVIVGKDNCKCGSRGTYFLVHGRVEKSELRGCSDVHAFSSGLGR